MLTGQGSLAKDPFVQIFSYEIIDQCSMESHFNHFTQKNSNQTRLNISPESHRRGVL